ncbi:MAG: hypothetical protein JNK47_03950 [Mesorhizobium sp.]|nr:hypothetical protein [Mesorhizobium sp.]MBL8576355.1 hypothetical protein [Mesorhizobium sp.]
MRPGDRLISDNGEQWIVVAHTDEYTETEIKRGLPGRYCFLVRPIETEFGRDMIYAFKHEDEIQHLQHFEAVIAQHDHVMHDGELLSVVREGKGGPFNLASLFMWLKNDDGDYFWAWRWQVSLMLMLGEDQPFSFLTAEWRPAVAGEF